MARARDLVDADRASLFLKEADGQTIYSVYADGRQSIRCRIGQGIAGYVVQTGKETIVDDVYADSRFDSSTDSQTQYRTRSALCVPLFDGGQEPCGCIEVINKRHGAFDHDDLKSMQRFAETVVPSMRSCVEFARVSTELSATREEPYGADGTCGGSKGRSRR